jgi:hypothetical protein
MIKLWNWIKNNPNRSMFLVPILLVAGISISHVVAWYNIANPMSWAIYLSIAIEVGAITALIAATNRIKGGIWFMFGIVTLIQMIGNIFFSYKEIDSSGELFKSWVELTGPLWEMLGSDPTDIPAMKRWLAFLEGGLLPVISLTSLHFFVKYEDPNSPKVEEKEVNIDKKEEINSPKLDDERIEQLTHLQKDSDKVWKKVKGLKEEGKLPETTEEDNLNEPTALANSEYRLNEVEHIEGEENNNEPTALVEEENPEDEIITPINQKVGKTLGDELNKTWKNIIKKRNNDIGRI